MSSVKNWKVLRPFSLAQYMAASAFLISVSPSIPCSGKILTPMLQVTVEALIFDQEFSGHPIEDPVRRDSSRRLHSSRRPARSGIRRRRRGPQYLVPGRNA